MARLEATERATLQQVIASLPEWRAHLDRTMFRLRAKTTIPDGARFLDVGAAQGGVLVAAAERGFRALGVEPYAPARQTALELAKKLDVSITIQPGRAEELPFDDARFDVVHALSVLEHVTDPAKVFAEVHRVLAPGGVFWFCTTSGLSPRQNEIAVFPAFGWYPDGVKRRIMKWTVAHRPAWIGNTDTPAMHWFTPAKTRTMLRDAGFGNVFDRWDLRREDEGGRLHAAALKAIRCGGLLHILADMCIPACIYAAVKPK